MRNKKKKFRLIIIFLLLLVILAEVIILAFFNSSNYENLTTEVAGKYAEKMVKKCENAKYRPSCYDKEIPKLMDQISMEDAFKVTAKVQELDDGYPYCHVLGHELSAREVRKDPSNWKEVLTRCPSGTCSNGCLHGGLQEKFRGESLNQEQIEKAKIDLNDLCEPREKWNPTSLEQASCYHAMGHLTMYMTNADIPVSIKLCGELASKVYQNGRDWSQFCYDGVFMQIFQPLEPEDFALVKGKQPIKENVEAFCAKYPGRPQVSCESEKWPLFFDLIKKPEGLAEFCKNDDKYTEGRCFSSTLFLMAAQFRLNSNKIFDYCSNMIEDKVSMCFSNAAGRMIETDYRNINKALDLCKRAEIIDKEGGCYKELVQYSTYNFHAGSKESLDLCNGMPETWRKQCLLRQ